jgi:hypothetical protein
MNSDIYDNLPPSIRQELIALTDEAQTLGIDEKMMAALLIPPLISDNLADAQTIAAQRLDTLRDAVSKNGTTLMRLLSHLSFLLFNEYLTRFRGATTPWQTTRWRLVLCGDDSLLVHAEESNQPDVVNIWSTLYKTCRKAHDLIVLGVTIGPKQGDFFFPLWVELWRQPGLRTQTRPQRMAAALMRLNQQVTEAGASLEGIDLALDNGYHSPIVADAGRTCGLVLTTQLRSNQKLSPIDGQPITIKDWQDLIRQTEPIRFDPRAGSQAYYWRKEAIHPYLGRGTLVIQRRKLRSGGFQHHYHFSQHQNAKAITVLQIAKRRWPIEVFFRESKQQLGLSHLPFRKWSSLRGHVAIRGVLYLLLAKVRRRLPWAKPNKTIGALKRRFGGTLAAIFASLFPLNRTQVA